MSITIIIIILQYQLIQEYYHLPLITLLQTLVQAEESHHTENKQTSSHKSNGSNSSKPNNTALSEFAAACVGVAHMT